MAAPRARIKVSTTENVAGPLSQHRLQIPVLLQLRSHRSSLQSRLQRLRKHSGRCGSRSHPSDRKSRATGLRRLDLDSGSGRDFPQKNRGYPPGEQEPCPSVGGHRLATIEKLPSLPLTRASLPAGENGRRSCPPFL